MPIVKKKNYMDELVEYLQKNIKKGYTKDSLKWALVSQGHSRLEVEKAIKIMDERLASQAPILNTRPQISYEVVRENTQKSEKLSFWRRLFWR